MPCVCGGGGEQQLKAFYQVHPESTAIMGGGELAAEEEAARARAERERREVRGWVGAMVSLGHASPKACHSWVAQSEEREGREVGGCVHALRRSIPLIVCTAYRWLYHDTVVASDRLTGCFLKRVVTDRPPVLPPRRRSCVRRGRRR